MPDTPIAAFVHLIQDTVAYLKLRPERRMDAVVQDLELFSKHRLMPIWHREKDAGRNPYVLSLVGLTNVGKSTLMEALLGFPVAPKGNGPVTAIPVEYRLDPTWAMNIQFRAAMRRAENLSFADAPALGDELRKRVVEIPEAQAAEVAWVTVRGPVNLLTPGLHLADTPGFGAAQVGEADGSHQRRLDEFILKRVHRVYFCVAAGSNLAISEAEKDFYQKMGRICGHVVITKWEGSDAGKNEYRRRYQPLFPGTELIFVNARRKMSGKGDPADMEKLREIILNNSAPEQRRSVCDREVVSAWRDIPEYMATVHDVDSVPWLPDALGQFADSCRRRPGMEELVAELQSNLKE